MSSKNNNLSSGAKESLPSIADFSVALIVSEWNAEITHSLRDACVKTLKIHNISEDNLYIISVPGAYELPMGARIMMGQEKIDAAICLGCVIKGETDHDKYINHAVANGIMNLGLTSQKPVIFGVLTPNTKQQALDRAGGKYGNKGIEAAVTAIKMLHHAAGTKNSKKNIGF
ncbi:MAG: 6,7-dimethyl-8-ribityllumazine synthase [Saprospiraceae bacterium]